MFSHVMKETKEVIQLVTIDMLILSIMKLFLTS